jgi:hypothetical protein
MELGDQSMLEVSKLCSLVPFMAGLDGRIVRERYIWLTIIFNRRYPRTDFPGCTQAFVLLPHHWLQLLPQADGYL